MRRLTHEILSSLALVLFGMIATGCGADARIAPDDSGHPGAVLVSRREALQPKLVLTGELESVQSERILVPRTPAWQLPIRWMEQDGALVAEGQKVLELDNTQFTGDLEQKKLAHSSAYNDLMRKKADVAGVLFDREYAVEQSRIALEKARIEAAVPRELLPQREYQELQLGRSRAEFVLAKAEEDLDTARRASEAEVVELDIALQRARDEIAVAEEAIGALSLTAPCDGILIVAENPGEGRKFQVGDNAWVGLPVMSIPDLTAMQVVARLSDVDDGRIEVGAAASATLDAYPDRAYHGTVTEIAPIAQEENEQSLRRSFRVNVRLSESDPERMRPGMSVRVEVLQPALDEAVVVPRVALDLSGESPRVSLADGSAATVRIGDCTATDCVVEEGLSEGVRLRVAG